jgi:isoleucyl-tRNA synthetase
MPKAGIRAEAIGGTVAERDYKATLKLPKTDFPMKANLPKREPETLARWNAANLYAQVLASRQDAPLWILHDGPPYANGRVHFGTALNKILKDFIVRAHAALGYRTPYVPGWDCHGMPIELQVARDLGEKILTMPKLEVRKLCHEFAEKWIDIQREEFIRLGVAGDWYKPYLTFAPEYEAAEIAVLRQMLEAGFIYRDLRPVHWCVDCRTALAEAEVEYREHTSPSIYVAFRLNQAAGDAGALAADEHDRGALAAAHRAGKLFAVIWTTTPWTLPANLGIALNESFDYVALQVGENYYIVAARLADAVAQACGLKVEKHIAIDRDALKALDGRDIFRHPFADRDGRLMFGDHVTAEAGTGLVHTAPGHGYEDFVLGNKYGLPTFTPVDDAGCFTAEAGEWAGRQVFEANPAIVEHLRARGALLKAEALSHSYPHCWRCKNPLIFRATEQWFLRIDHNGLRERALAEIDRVQWVPGWARDRIRNMVESRPDWCLSRQRAWGVPIPALKCADCAKVILDTAVLRRAEEIFAREGSDAWYARPVADFAGQLRCPSCDGAEFIKQEDVLDVWFDSGCSHAAVLVQERGLQWPCDAYVEGVDQTRGWFQVSLITAAAARGQAPYSTVVSHGLALDELGRKMSKSLGNFEYASEVVNRMGADVFRLVFASVDYSSDMNVGDNLLSAVAEAYRKIRNTCRFLLGNLADFDPARDTVAPAAMLEFDRFIMMRTERLKAAVRRAYEEFDFQAAYQAILNFVVIDLSSLYIDVARDRLYCDGANSRERRSAQTALYLMLDALTRMLAPLIPFTTDEIYLHIPGRSASSVHLLTLAEADPRFVDAELEVRWAGLIQIRDQALKVLETMRQAGSIGAPLDARLSLGVAAAESQALAETLQRYHASLKDLFIVSDVALLADHEIARLKARANGGDAFSADGKFGRLGAQPPVIVVGERAPGLKCQRCWRYFEDSGDSALDPRCRAVVAALSA